MAITIVAITILGHDDIHSRWSAVVTDTHLTGMELSEAVTKAAKEGGVFDVADLLRNNILHFTTRTGDKIEISSDMTTCLVTHPVGGMSMLAAEGEG